MSDETDRVTVSTYVPAYQRDRWRKHAERLDMSLSEFVRTMVQAGRRGFAPDDSEEKPEEPDDPGTDPRGNGLKDGVVEALERTGPLEWDELADELNGDFEDRLEEAVQELQQGNRVGHNGRRGGYFLMEAGDGE